MGVITGMIFAGAIVAGSVIIGSFLLAGVRKCGHIVLELLHR